MDDATARAEARRLGLHVRGTLGILVQAYRRHHLSFLQVELLLEEIASRPDIWISAQLCNQVLAQLRSNE
jgi:predicted nucleic acid-binding protein